MSFMPFLTCVLAVKNVVDIDLVNHNAKAEATRWQPDT